MLARVKEVRERLRNPPNGHFSEETEILSAPALRRQRVAQIRETERARRDVEIQETIARAIRLTEEAQARNSFITLAAVTNPFVERHIPTVNQILAAVCAYYGISAVDIISQRREAAVVRPRHIACWLAKNLTPRSFPDIGRRMGNRDHTSIMHAVSRVEAMRSEQPGLQAEIDELKRWLGCE